MLVFLRDHTEGLFLVGELEDVIINKFIEGANDGMMILAEVFEEVVDVDGDTFDDTFQTVGLVFLDSGTRDVAIGFEMVIVDGRNFTVVLEYRVLDCLAIVGRSDELVGGNQEDIIWRCMQYLIRRIGLASAITALANVIEIGDVARKVVLAEGTISANQELIVRLGLAFLGRDVIEFAFYVISSDGQFQPQVREEFQEIA